MGQRNSMCRSRMLVLRPCVFFLLGIAVIAISCGAAISRETLSASCNEGSAGDCLSLGFMYQKGQDGRADATMARLYFERACAKGESIGCKRAGKMWEVGEGGPRSMLKAKWFQERAVELSPVANSE